MSKIPRAVVAAGLGIGTFMIVDSYLEPSPQETYAVQDVNECVAALGNKAIEATELHETCKAYDENYTPTSLSQTLAEEGRTITFSLPDPIALLQNESPNAAVIDQDIVQANTERRGESILVASMAGLAVAFAAGNTKTLKRLDDVPLGRRKKVRPVSGTVRTE